MVSDQCCQFDLRNTIYILNKYLAFLFYFEDIYYLGQELTMLHSRNEIHNALKSSNVLLQSDMPSYKCCYQDEVLEACLDTYA